MNEENKTEIKLDLGCGNDKKPGFIGIDKYMEPGVTDVIVDLDAPGMTLPYSDDSVTEIRAEQFLEHIHNLFPLMNECHRVLKKDGIFEIIVPLFPSRSSMDDHTHVRFFTKSTFHYFTKNPPGNYKNPDLKGTWRVLLNDWSPLVHEEGDRIIYSDMRELHIIIVPDKEVYVRSLLS